MDICRHRRNHGGHPDHGTGEYDNKKYIFYRRANRNGAEADISGANVLPPSGGFEVAQLQGGRHK